MTRLCVMAVAILAMSAVPALPCDIIAKGPPQTPLQIVQNLVAGAQVIVYVRVTGHTMEGVTDADNFPQSVGNVVFNVLRVIKGQLRGSELRANGGLIESDDFNDGLVPYAQIRMEGRRGWCYAYGYRPGGEYLLLLRENEKGVLDPYWASLAPTNEQVRGASDPWIEWVDKEVQRRR